MISQFLDRAGQVLFIFMCMVTTGVGIKYLVSTDQVEAALPSPYAAGVQLPGVSRLNPQGATALLVLGLSTRCRFCTDSMAFYKRLSAQPTLPAGALQLSVVSVEPERQMREYLVRQGLDVPTVVPGLEVGFTMAATPTLVLADKSGKVVASWEGLLDAEREQDVLSRVAELVGKQ